MVVVPGKGEGYGTGTEVLIVKLRGNKYQEASNSHYEVLKICLLEVVLSVVLARVVGLIPGEA